MQAPTSNIEQDRQQLVSASDQGTLAKIGVFTKLSGPGWLQGAITLGGGSLAGSLYLGVIGGYQLLWLQPLMMLLGIVMLSAISYVTLSVDEPPFRAINRHINPVLGWGWLLAALLANLVWAMPQFSLGTAALQQNLLPELLGAESHKYSVAALLFVVGAAIVWFYDSGGWGIRLFEVVLKLMVGIIVVSFFGVVVALTLSDEGLQWGAIFSGFIPNLRLLFEPADRFADILGQTSAPEYWREKILHSQRNRMVTASATAVGINMTFLLPYSMRKRGWDRNFRGLAVFDLSTGLFIPFLLATSCVVIAAATQFHGRYDLGLLGEGKVTVATEKLRGDYEIGLNGIAAELAKKSGGEVNEKQIEQIKQSELTPGDRKVAAMLVRRDAFLLANSLEDLTGKTIAQTVFGVGVLGMAISTIIILMLINGFCVCEMLNVPIAGMTYRMGALLPGITGALGFLLLWGKDEPRFWLAVPTSIFGMVLLPIAYVTFFFMMNNKSLLGPHRLAGVKRILSNTAMFVAIVAATIGAGWSIWSNPKVRWYGLAAAGVFVVLTIVVQLLRKPSDGRSFQDPHQ